ncbi:DNA-packaging protein [Chitinophaga pinensis]|uniref:Uncharacterized protein n=1 Tax=Chitinophaga pinensis (strain ATCC 43595 / DSM 2588 / LMG 13176 / NBRC 15968 / NCIMB 11800 / UQM 2034) TaxID=485918 RepID=A0A979GXQ5_CHIPD|nr:DNA-packaging protein [Chitinophaga pinensis]ACU61340.1 hypothetical protein Cpin_3878 [Chitinophaga pinensis DSM 2588]
MAKGKIKAPGIKIADLPPMSTPDFETEDILKVEHKYSIKGAGGRPPLYETPEELSAAVDAYFIYCEGEFHIETEVTVKKKKGKSDNDEDDDQDVSTHEKKVWDRWPEAPTVTGLTLFLGFAHRQSLDDQEERGAEFSDIIKRGRLRVEHGYEKRLFHDRPTGAIFALSNMGWKNQHQFDHTTKGDKISSQMDVSKLSEDDLVKLAELQSKVRGE